MTKVQAKQTALNLCIVMTDVVVIIIIIIIIKTNNYLLNESVVSQSNSDNI